MLRFLKRPQTQFAGRVPVESQTVDTIGLPRASAVLHFPPLSFRAEEEMDGGPAFTESDNANQISDIASPAPCEGGQRQEVVLLQSCRLGVGDPLVITEH